jgi:uncharacterized protein (TIGR02145 family)/prepilin-type N-terminal cleavage/methylation domain-containing protein
MINNIDKKAFTLLEILLVMAILAIGAGLIITLFNPLKIFQNTENLTIESDKLDIKTAYINYKIEYEGDHPFEGEIVRGIYYKICREEITDCDLGNFEVSLNRLKDIGMLSEIPVNPAATSARYTGYLIKDIDGATFDVVSQTDAFGSAENTTAGECFYFDTLEYCSIAGQNSTLWLDRNLGATQKAISLDDQGAYGDLYQWGRFTDGHQIRTSSNQSGQSTEFVPGANFITRVTPQFNWYAGINIDDLWQGFEGINNPCPSTWRIPTAAEWQTEIDYLQTENIAGGFSSNLKLVAGGRRGQTGSISELNNIGYYWSADRNASTDNAYYVRLDSSAAIVASGSRIQGMSVRCIKDASATTQIEETAVYSLKNNALGKCTGQFDINGNYEAGVPLDSANSIDVSVFVASIGSYSITTDTINGFKFSKSGTFDSTGNVVVNLSHNGGAPQTSGTDTYTTSGGGTTCTFNLEVD